MTTFSDILAALPSLSSQELADVAARAKALQGLGGPPAPAAPEGDQMFVLNAIDEVLLSLGLGRTSVQALNALPGWKAKVPPLMEWLREHLPTRTEQYVVLQIGFKLLLEEQQRFKAAGARTLLMQLHRVPAIIARNFPHYAETGLLHMLVRRGDDDTAGQ